jgi:hypothetical protein
VFAAAPFPLAIGFAISWNELSSESLSLSSFRITGQRRLTPFGASVTGIAAQDESVLSDSTFQELEQTASIAGGCERADNID